MKALLHHFCVQSITCILAKNLESRSAKFDIIGTGIFSGYSFDLL